MYNGVVLLTLVDNSCKQLCCIVVSLSYRRSILFMSHISSDTIYFNYVHYSFINLLGEPLDVFLIMKKYICSLMQPFRRHLVTNTKVLKFLRIGKIPSSFVFHTFILLLTHIRMHIFNNLFRRLLSNSLQNISSSN